MAAPLKALVKGFGRSLGIGFVQGATLFVADRIFNKGRISKAIFGDRDRDEEGDRRDPAA
jgi:hypothetical protein